MAIRRSLFWLFLLALVVALAGCGKRIPKPTLSGTGSIEVQATDKSGPVTGALVTLMSDSKQTLDEQQTDETGMTTFEKVVQGEGYLVRVSKANLEGQATVAVLGGEKTVAKIALSLSGGPGGVLHGVVRSMAMDAPVSGAKVEVLGASVSAQSGPDGSYRIEGVPAGEQKVQVSAPGYKSVLGEVSIEAGGSRSLDLYVYPASAGSRAGNTLITSLNRVVEVDMWHAIASEFKASAAWSTTISRRSDSLLVADSGKNAVLETTPNGTVIKVFNSTSFMQLGFGGLKAPRGAVRLVNGNMLVADTGNDRIVEIDDLDRKVWEFKTRLNQPRWAERLPNGHTLIVDTGNHRVLEIDPKGAPVWALGDGSTDVLNNPTFAQRLPNGNTLVTDAGNSRVMEVDPKCRLVWMVGGGRALESDRPLRNPNSAIRLPNGNTLIADTGNHRVIEVDPKNGTVWKQPVDGPLYATRF